MDNMLKYGEICSQIKGKEVDYKIEVFEKFWNELAKNKIDEDVSYFTVRSLINLYIEKSDKEKLIYWVDYIFLCNLKRIDYGEREFLAGKVALELGEKRKAFCYFDLSFKKSKGSYFENSSDKYVKFYFDNKLSCLD